MPMRMGWSLTPQKPWYRRAVAAVVKWAVREELEDLEQHDNQLHGYIANHERVESFEKAAERRFKLDQERLAKTHEDWKAVTAKHSEVSAAILDEAKKQTESLERIATRVEAKL